MRKRSVKLGAAFVSTVLLVAVVTTATFAQGAGPVSVWPKVIGGQRLMQCVAPVAPAQQFGAPGISGYGQSGESGYGPQTILPGYGVGGLGAMMQQFDFGCGGPGMTDASDPIGGRGYDRSAATGQRLTAEQVRQAVAAYLAGYYNNPDLEVVRLLEFEQNFYAQVAEKSTGINACELLVDPYAGAVQPEYGPNRMWNTKYGQMSDLGGMMPSSVIDGLAPVQPTARMPVTADQASTLAQQYLDAHKTSLTVEKDLNVFYGYYTLHSLDKAGNTVGMLSVNGYSGQVWYHVWHGKFIGEADGM